METKTGSRRSGGCGRGVPLWKTERRRLCAISGTNVLHQKEVRGFVSHSTQNKVRSLFKLRLFGVHFVPYLKQGGVRKLELNELLTRVTGSFICHCF